MVFTKLAESSWRTLLFWIGPPGLVIAGLALLTLAEPRTSSANAVTSLMNALRPKPKSQVPAEDMVTATQYSRVRPSLLGVCLRTSQVLLPVVVLHKHRIMQSSPCRRCYCILLPAVDCSAARVLTSGVACVAACI